MFIHSWVRRIKESTPFRIDPAEIARHENGEACFQPVPAWSECPGACSSFEDEVAVALVVGNWSVARFNLLGQRVPVT